jgi:hypothetical protein
MNLLRQIRLFGQWYSRHFWWILLAIVVFSFFGMLIQAKTTMVQAAEKVRSTGHNNPSWTLRLEPAMGSTPFYTWERSNPLIVFFSPECGHCQEIVPELVAKQPSRPLLLVATRSTDDSTLRRFVREKLSTVPPIYRDIHGEFANWYGLAVVPRLIDVQGDTISVVVPTPGIFDNRQ